MTPKEIYSPGLHKLMTINVSDNQKLTSSSDFIVFTDKILEKYDLEKVGFTVHNFENNSFTIAVCLMESHICIHTWPEFNQLTLDVYLCNYLKENSNLVRLISEDYIKYFEGVIIKDFEIFR